MELPLHQYAVIEIICPADRQFFPDMGRCGRPGHQLPVLRMDPGVHIAFRILEIGAGLTPIEQDSSAAAQPVRRHLVCVQVHVTDGLIVYAQPLDDLQLPEILLVDEPALLIICLEALLLFHVLADQQVPFQQHPIPLLRSVPQEHVEDVPNAIDVDEMAIVLDPADCAVLAMDAVLHIVQIVLAGRDLRPYALLHRFQVLRVDEAAEGATRERPKVFHRIALADPQHPSVGVYDLLAPIRTIDQKAAGHLVHEPCQGRSPTRLLSSLSRRTRTTFRRRPQGTKDLFEQAGPILTFLHGHLPLFLLQILP